MELEYRQFTTPAELHKAINTLRGIVSGISCDRDISSDEINELTHWCLIHSHLEGRHPFSEIIPAIRKACEDGIITEEESLDILWVCTSFADNGSYYNAATSSIQFLSGLVHGIMADGVITDSEVHVLQKWVEDNDFLCGTYPFDEINSLLTDILADGKIDTDERATLMAFFSNLIEFNNSYNLVEADYVDLRTTYSVDGICAVCPEITIPGNLFCFTGESYKGTRKELTETITNLGGVFRSSVSKKTNYLVVGNAGNPCWAYACYGRKIEEAVRLRKEGFQVVIVNETDFWDAVEDLKA